MFQDQIDDLQIELSKHNEAKRTLRKLNLFVLDNSLRETGFGHLRGHTLENKWKIYKEIRKVGIKHIIVESFNHMTRMGDAFIRDLMAKKDPEVNYYAFTDFLEKIDENRIPDENHIPSSLLSIKERGISNAIIEVDLVHHGIDYEKFNGKKICALLLKRFKWIRSNVSKDSIIFVHIRDFTDCITAHPRRLFYLVNFLSTLSPKDRIWGITFGDDGTHQSEELSVWTKCVQKEMNKCGWKDGHILIHIQEKFALANGIQLDCLANGATGVWAGLCEEGAALGHASTTLTLMNLIRIGNKTVEKTYDCLKLRDAARTITEITTGLPCHRNRPVIGERAIDVVFRREPLRPLFKEFNIPDFLGLDNIVRISASSTPLMLMNKLLLYHGANPDFNFQRASKMKRRVLTDLKAEKREDYSSAVGISILYERAGGILTPDMRAAINKAKGREAHMDKLRDEIRELWDEWDIRDGVKDDEVDLDAFFNGFMAPYFGCYRTDESKVALRAIDVDSDGKVHWDEFGIYLKYASRQYPEIETAEELLDLAFRKGMIPAMQYEISKDRPIMIFLDEGDEVDYYKRLVYKPDAEFTAS